MKQAETLYTCVQKPTDVTDEEWALWIKPDVRRFIASYLGVEFSTFEEMVTAKGQTERVAAR